MLSWKHNSHCIIIPIHLKLSQCEHHEKRNYSLRKHDDPNDRKYRERGIFMEVLWNNFSFWVISQTLMCFSYSFMYNSACSKKWFNKWNVEVCPSSPTLFNLELVMLLHKKKKITLTFTSLFTVLIFASQKAPRYLALTSVPTVR